MNRDDKHGEWYESGCSPIGTIEILERKSGGDVHICCCSDSDVADQIVRDHNSKRGLVEALKAADKRIASMEAFATYCIIGRRPTKEMIRSRVDTHDAGNVVKQALAEAGEAP